MVTELDILCYLTLKWLFSIALLSMDQFNWRLSGACKGNDGKNTAALCNYLYTFTVIFLKTVQTKQST